MRPFIRTVSAALVLWLLCPPVVSQTPAPQPNRPRPQNRPPRPTGTKWDAMDTGRFFCSGLEVAGVDGKMRRPVLKGISIKLGETNEAAMCFDTERLRWAIGWTGGFLKLPVGREGLEGVPRPVGTVAFESSVLPGWADKNGGFAEAKPPVKDGGELVSFGPLPKEWAKWRGLYQNGEQVILSYTVGKARVLELPGYDSASGLFTRTFQIDGMAWPRHSARSARASGSVSASSLRNTRHPACAATRENCGSCSSTSWATPSSSPRPAACMRASNARVVIAGCSR
jgi:hypothetical protein